MMQRLRPHRRLHALGKAAAIACLVTALAAAAHAQAPAESAHEAVQLGRDALRSGARYPWYDQQDDSLRGVRARAANPAENPRDWVWRDPNLDLPSNSWWQEILRMIGAGIKAIFWIALIAALLLGVWVLSRMYLRREGEYADAGAAEADFIGSDADRIERLPFAAPTGRGDLLEEARLASERGDYRRAVVFLYSYLLVQLDRGRIIRLARGKTNRQYLREVRRRPELRPMFETTMLAFEDVYFGDHDLSRRRFEECWQGLSDFQQSLATESA